MGNIIRIIDSSDVLKQGSCYPLPGDNLDSISIVCDDIIKDVDFYLNNYLIVASSDELVYIFDLNGKIVHSFPHTFVNNGDSITHFTFDKNGTKLITSSFDGEIRLWDVELEKCIFHDMMGHCTNFSPDGLSIASTSHNRGTIVCAFQNELNFKSDYICHSLDCNSDGTNHLVLTKDNMLIEHNIQNANSSLIFNGCSDVVVTACYTPDNLQIAAILKDNTIRMINVANRDCLKIIKDEYGDKYLSSIKKITVSPNNSFIATTYGKWPLFSIVKSYRENAKKIGIWDVIHQRVLNILEGHKDVVNAVCFDPMRNLLISASDDKTIRVWNIISGKCLRILTKTRDDGHIQSVQDIAFNSDGSLFASVSSDTTVKIWDSKTYKCIKTLKGHKAEIKGVCFAFDNEMNRQLILSVSPYESLRVWDVKSGQCVYEYKIGDNFVKVKFDVNKRVIVVFAQDQSDFSIVMTSVIKFPKIQELMDRFNSIPLTTEQRKQYYLE